jgi:metallo-beta-lactamase family protein
MAVKLKFLGAARNITGSQYYLESKGIRLLVDCGLYQEREFLERNWAPFPISPKALDALLLTHAHLDHCGLVPKLVREGFQGRIYCTAATADIAEVMLLDSAKLQEEDAEFKKKRHEREGRRGRFPEVPLYTADDVQASLPLFSPLPYRKTLQLGNGIKATFFNAGHVLGSAMVLVTTSEGAVERTVLFSGDVGRWNAPMLQDPTLFAEADYVIVESTYGDRLHESFADVSKRFAEEINLTLKAGGNIVVPSFALERAQELLYYLDELTMQHRVPQLKVFLDSPMAASINKIFERHPELYDQEMTRLVHSHRSPFELPGLRIVQTVEESKAINAVKSGAMIIAGSGMCTGGRIKHHLVTNISRPESTILFVGYQAVGTLGRQIVDDAETVRILGQYHPVRARVAQIHGFSAHADRDELFRWLSGLKRAPKHVFITHGEPEVAESFANLLREETGWEVSIPDYLAEVELD